MKPAQRLDNVQPYYFATKLAEIRRRQEGGEDIVNLGIGSPDLGPDVSVIAALQSAADDAHAFQYKPYRGIIELREALCAWYAKVYHVRFEINEVLPLLGSKEGVGFVSLSYLNEGDTALVPDPGYLAYSSATRMAGGRPVAYDLLESNNWQPDVDQLADLMDERTRILWLNYPSMPCGVQADTGIIEAIISLATERNVLVVNDNPYSQILFDDAFSIHQIVRSPFVLELNSLSKGYHLAGMRMGMITGDCNLIDTVFRVQSNFGSGMFEPAQRAAIAALGLTSEWSMQINATYQRRRDIAERIAQKLGCHISGTEGGLFVWARTPKGVVNSMEFCDVLLDTIGVFIAPGSIFGKNGEGFVRISLCCDEKDLIEVEQRIDRHMKMDRYE